MSVVSVERLRYRNPKIFKKCKRCGAQATDCGCRQGRNHASRDRATRSLLHLNSHLRNGGHISSYCPDCGRGEVDLDYVSGDTVCVYCGCVVDFGGLLGYGWNIYGSSGSKGYETLVYVREKLRSLHGTDPWIWDTHWELILAQIKEEYHTEEGYIDYPLLNRILGPKTFGDICKRVRDPISGEFILEKKKYGERWIQVGIRRGLAE